MNFQKVSGKKIRIGGIDGEKKMGFFTDSPHSAFTSHHGLQQDAVRNWTFKALALSEVTITIREVVALYRVNLGNVQAYLPA